MSYEDDQDEIVESAREIAYLKRELRVKTTILNGFPLCPDHRDKQSGKDCRACKIERLERENAKLLDLKVSIGLALGDDAGPPFVDTITRYRQRLRELERVNAALVKAAIDVTWFDYSTCDEDVQRAIGKLRALTHATPPDAPEDET